MSKRIHRNNNIDYFFFNVSNSKYCFRQRTKIQDLQKESETSSSKFKKTVDQSNKNCFTLKIIIILKMTKQMITRNCYVRPIAYICPQDKCSVTNFLLYLTNLRALERSNQSALLLWTVMLFIGKLVFENFFKCF